MKKYFDIVTAKVKSCGKAIKPGNRSNKAGEHPVSVRNKHHLIMAVLALAGIVGSITAVTQLPITVSNSVGGRELPIYCVETDQKQVALSFDAAWGNEDTRDILEILEKHNVKVTFFMTGGWVETDTY